MAGDLDELERRIAEAQQAQAAQDEAAAPVKPVSGMRAGSDFLAHVIAGTILGYVLDRFLGTLPWCLIVFCVLGFAAGVFSANRAMRKTPAK